MLSSWDTGTKKHSGAWQDCCMTLILNFIRKNTASGHRSFCATEEDLVHAVVSHGYGIRVDVAPEHEMEKVLFAADELTGLIWAAAKMRPSKSTKDMELSSLKKKFKDKKFAAGCSRDVIRRGADQLGWELDKLMEQTILAMRSCEDRVNKEMEELEF